jgi:DNA modification methylase
VTVRLLEGDALVRLAETEAASIDACVTDPPYGLGFMGRMWDHGIPGVPYWTEVLRVLKPGSHLVAFGGTRTYHRLTCAAEDAGFEIRDCLMWLYGSGFPKGKGCLKPGWEPIVLARKPAPAPWLNVDGCRIGTESTRRTDGWR